MAFDGVVISNIVYDLKEKLTGGRIYKIYQPENDELNIVIKNNKDLYTGTVKGKSHVGTEFLYAFEKAHR